MWVQRFEEDVARDTRFEASLLVRAWVVVSIIFFLVLLRRLFT